MVLSRGKRTMHGPSRLLVLLAVPFVLAACGDDPEPVVEVPSWAKVAPEQVAEAKKHGVPVAFENDLGMRFVLIPAGTFLMGSPEDEEGRDDDETQHDVTITKPFYMQTTEVTNEQFRRWRSMHDSGEHGGHSLNAAQQPVVMVAWDDAHAFAAWLSERDAFRRYRLPTEAMWERACRAGSITRYVWGNDDAVGWRHANGMDEETTKVLGEPIFPWEGDDGHRVAAPVGRYPPNPWGVHDMHGNVWEWCADEYGPYPGVLVVDPTGPSGDGEQRVQRGGSWFSAPKWARSAARDWYMPDKGHDCYGFRLVSPLPEPKQDATE